MKTLKKNLFAILAFFSAIIGGLLIYISRKNSENAGLKADKDLTNRKNESKVVDDKIKSAQDQIDKLDEEMIKPVDDSFWDDYTKGKKK